MTRLPRARRQLGQNFLVDPGVARRIVDLLAPAFDETVLEIGPGDGALTTVLLERCDHLHAVEVDAALAERLERRHGARLKLIRGDVLKLDLGVLAANASVTVVGNLPYNISKPIANLLVRQRRHVERAVLMFQREVADRLEADPGTRAYGPLTILAGRAYRIRRGFDVRPDAFRPRPKVDSSVTVWQRRPDGPSDEEEARLRRCLAACFASRRKTLRNNLRAALGDAAAVAALLARCGIDGERRPEQLDPAAFLLLSRAWPAP